MKKRILVLINLLIVLFSFLFLKDLYRGFRDFNSAKNLSVELESLNPTNEETNNSNDKDFKKIYESLKKINEDFKFWLKIDNTRVNYPVVQANNNDFYLNKDFKKNEHRHGSLFVDSNTNFDKDFNTIIYGHNTKANNMMTDIVKFKEKDFFNKNNKLTIIDKNNRYSFEVFSVYTIRGFDDPSYLYELNKKENRKEKIKEIKERSYFKNINKFNDSKMLTLITCSYEKNNTRTVVHFNLIDKEKIQFH